MSQMWGSDVPISMPEPLDSSRDVYVDMGALCFTLSGVAHNFREADLEAYTYPMYTPTTFGLTGGEVS